MTTVLLSPSETTLARLLKHEAIVSPIPEQKGADILIYTIRGLWGIQRKEVPSDFISSITDGRMTRETTLLTRHCQYRVLLCEGKFRYFPNDHLALGRREPSRFTRSHIRGILLDVKLIKGVDVDYTEDLDDTVSYIRAIAHYMSQEKHLGLFSRPSAKGTWGVPTAKDTELWLLQSFPGIGVAIADSIVSYFGEVPLRWSCTLDELKQVPKLNPKRAIEIWDALSHLPSHPPLSEFDRLRAHIEEAE